MDDETDAPTKLRLWQALTMTRSKDLAVRTGISYEHMRSLRVGFRRPSLDVAFALEDATGGAIPASAWRIKRNG